MLKLLLKLYPQRFIEQMGDNWLIDSNLDLARAKQLSYRFVVSFWVGAVIGNLRGAMTAHANEWARKVQVGVAVTSCGQTIMFNGDNKEEAASLIGRSFMINAIGAAIFGFMTFKIFNGLYINSSAEILWESIKGDITVAFMGLSVIVSQALLAGAGLWLAWKHRSHGNTLWSNIPSGAFFVLHVFMVVGVTSITDQLIRMGETASSMTETFVSYQDTMVALGYKDGNGNELEWTATDISDAQCVRANSVLDLIKNREIRLAKSSGEPIGLIVVRGMAQSTWSRGCMTDQQFLSMGSELFDAAQLTPQQQRKWDWMSFGMAEHRNEVAERLDVSAQTWCVMNKQRQIYKSEGTVDVKEIEHECSLILGADNSVLPKQTT